MPNEIITPISLISPFVDLSRSCNMCWIWEWSVRDFGWCCHCSLSFISVESISISFSFTSFFFGLECFYFQLNIYIFLLDSLCHEKVRYLAPSGLLRNVSVSIRPGTKPSSVPSDGSRTILVPKSMSSFLVCLMIRLKFQEKFYIDLIFMNNHLGCIHIANSRNV